MTDHNTERPAGQDAATENAAPQAGQDTTAPPSQEGHAAGPAVAAPSSDLRGRLEEDASWWERPAIEPACARVTAKLEREAAAALAELEEENVNLSENYIELVADVRLEMDKAAAAEQRASELEQAVKQRDTLLGIAERRSEDLRELLKEALPFVDTNPDLHRIGGDELRARCERELGERK